MKSQAFKADTRQKPCLSGTERSEGIRLEEQTERYREPAQHCKAVQVFDSLSDCLSHMVLATIPSAQAAT